MQRNAERNTMFCSILAVLFFSIILEVHLPCSYFEYTVCF